jgi:hypothetical protein
MAPPTLQHSYKGRSNGNEKEMPVAVNDEGFEFDTRFNSDTSSLPSPPAGETASYEGVSGTRKQLEPSDFEFLRTLGTGTSISACQ